MFHTKKFRVLHSVVSVLLITFVISSAVSKSVIEDIPDSPRDLGILSYLGLARRSCPSPPDIPSGVVVKREYFKKSVNNRFEVDTWFWKVAPRNPTQMIILSNWAHYNEYTLKPLEFFRSLTSLTAARDANCSKVLLIDTTSTLNNMKLVGASRSLVAVETGVTITALMEFLDELKLELPVVPINMQSTIGEAVAVGAYGTGVNTHKEKSIPFGTVSSLIMSFKTIVWDRTIEAYTLKKFDRPDPRSVAFLTNLGRSFLTEVTLAVKPATSFRCQTFSDFSSENLFASPNSSFSLMEESFAYLVEEYGKIEVSFYPYVDRSWVKVWSKETTRPLGSIRVNKPVPSVLSRSVPNFMKNLVSTFTSTFPSFSPSVSRLMFDIGVFRMRLAGVNDIWGSSKNTFPAFTTDYDSAAYHRGGYVIITSRNEIQQVVYDFYEQFSLFRDQFANLGKFPANRPVKIRASGLDSVGSVGNNSIFLASPSLSVLSPVKNHPEFDVAVIIEMEYLPESYSAKEFFSELEGWIFRNYQGDYASVRPLWTTEWSQTNESPFTSDWVLKDLIPGSYGPAWTKAIKVLDFYDPHGVFSNPFLDSLFERESTTGVMNSV